MIPIARPGVRRRKVVSWQRLSVRLAAGLVACASVSPFGRLTAAESNEWWAVKPLIQPAVPKNVAWGPDQKSTTNPLDAFVRATLEEKGLSPAPEADRRTLIRRVTFDLVGLPPSPDEINAFLKDQDR